VLSRGISEYTPLAIRVRSRGTKAMSNPNSASIVNDTRMAQSGITESDVGVHVSMPTS
jgi:hypothetical protein